MDLPLYFAITLELIGFCLFLKILYSYKAPVTSKSTNLIPKVSWIVNSHGELGVKVDAICYFFYRGETLIYDDVAANIRNNLKIRPLFRSEFEDLIHPKNLMLTERGDYTVGSGWEPIDHFEKEHKH